MADTALPFVPPGAGASLNAPISRDIVLGNTPTGDVLTIPKEDRFRHVVMWGDGHSGEQALVEKMIVQDCKSGAGVVIFDATGNITEHIGETIKETRSTEVTMFSLAEPDGLSYVNFFVRGDQHRMMAVYQALYDCLDPLHTDAIGPRTEEILRFAAGLACDIPGATLGTIYQIITEEAYTKSYLIDATIPAVRDFWNNLYTAVDQKERNELLGYTASKLEPFFINDFMKPYLEARKREPWMNVTESIKKNQVLVFNLESTQVGSAVQSLFAKLLMGEVCISCYRKYGLLEAERGDTFVYFAGNPELYTTYYSHLIAEARPERVGITTVMQTNDMSTAQWTSITANTANWVLFKNTQEQAEEALKTIRLGAVTAGEIAELPTRTAYFSSVLTGKTEKITVSD